MDFHQTWYILSHAKRGITPYLKSIGFQIPLRNKYVPILVKIHWSMLMLDCSQGCYTIKTIILIRTLRTKGPIVVLSSFSCKNVTLLLSNYGFIWYHVKYTNVINLDVMWNTQYVDARLFPRMLHDKNNWPGDLDLWLWKSIRFQILLRTKYVQSLVAIGPVVSEEKIKMWNVAGRTTDEKWWQ
jgi:hypothetical protein